MRINSTNGVNPNPGQARMQQQKDSVSKDIQKQIADKQKELQNLSSNSELGMEEKQKKRQEIMQEISDLNNQLRQHQMELRREAAQTRKNQSSGSSVDELTGGRTKKAGKQGRVMSQASMQAVISADSAVKQAQIQGSTANRLENQAHILESEIKQDKGRTDVTKKEEELTRVEQRAEEAEASQMNTLSDAGELIEKAKETESKETQTKEKAEKTESKETQTKEKAEKTELKETQTKEKEGKRDKSGKEKSANQAGEDRKYPSIDVYL